VTGPWIVAFSVLAIAVVLLTIVVLGLVQRIGQVLQRVEALLTNNSGVQNPINMLVPTGIPAPDVPDAPGAHGKLVLFLEAGCEACQVLVADLNRKRLSTEAVSLIAVVDDPDSPIASLPRSWRVVHDRDRLVAQAWKVSATPVSYAVDPTGIIRAAGFPNTSRDLQRLLKEGMRIQHRTVRPPRHPHDHQYLEMSKHEH